MEGLVGFVLIKVGADSVGFEVHPLTKIRVVLFDMFDTLMMIERDHAFYSPSLHGAYEFLVANGVSVGFEEFEKTYVSVRDAIFAEVDAELGEPHFNVRIAGTLKRLGYDCDVSSPLVVGATDAFCERFMTYVRIDEHAEGMLRKLHGRYKLGVVSNFAIPECVTRLLERQGIAKLFDVVIVSGAVNKRKPHPDIYQKALEKLGVKASETVFVGDTVDADVQGAKAAGMKTIYIERRLQEDAEAACPDQTIKSLEQLPAAIERLQHD
jgi:HAD superfamily hydrolase (TIGR01509 family)